MADEKKTTVIDRKLPEELIRLINEHFAPDAEAYLIRKQGDEVWRADRNPAKHGDKYERLGMCLRVADRELDVWLDGTCRLSGNSTAVAGDDEEF